MDELPSSQFTFTSTLHFNRPMFDLSTLSLTSRTKTKESKATYESVKRSMRMCNGWMGK